MKKNFWVAFIVLAVHSSGPNPAEALIIDNGAFTTDTESGLDWLDLTATRGQSWNAIYDQVHPGGGLEGWLFATNAQVVELVNNYAGLALPVLDVSGDGVYPPAELPYGSVAGLIDLLGVTWESSTVDYPVYKIANGMIWDMGNAFDGKNVRVDVLSTMAGPGGFQQDSFGQAAYHTLDTMGAWDVGTFLVRNHVDSTPVPEPATILLMGSGLLGLAGRIARRKETA